MIGKQAIHTTCDTTNVVFILKQSTLSIQPNWSWSVQTGHRPSKKSVRKSEAYFQIEVEGGGDRNIYTVLIEPNSGLKVDRV